LDELIVIPFAGLGELDVERLSCREDHLSGEGPCDMGDHGDPVTASELDRVWVVVDVDVGEDAGELLDRGGVRCGRSTV
jgi:hypothetical protein